MTGIILFFAIIYVAGFLSFLYGRRMVNILLGIYAFCGTYQLVLTRFPTMPHVIWIAIGAGVLAVLLVQFAKSVAFFLLGAVIGMMIAMTVLSFFPNLPSYAHIGIIVGCGLVLGFLTARYDDTLIRYGTSYIGGEMLTTASLMLILSSSLLPGMMSEDIMASISNVADYLYGTFAAQYSLWIIAGSIVLMFLGAAFQRKH